MSASRTSSKYGARSKEPFAIRISHTFRREKSTRCLLTMRFFLQRLLLFPKDKPEAFSFQFVLKLYQWSACYFSRGRGKDRFAEVEASSKHISENTELPKIYWERLQRFTESFRNTTPDSDREKIEIIVGIDEGDKVFDSKAARETIKHMLPCTVRFVSGKYVAFGLTSVDRQNTISSFC